MLRDHDPLQRVVRMVVPACLVALLLWFASALETSPGSSTRRQTTRLRFGANALTTIDPSCARSSPLPTT